MEEKNNTPLISCRCTYCGAPIEVEPDQETATCPYCDTTFFINNAYKKTDNTKSDSSSTDAYDYGMDNDEQDTQAPFSSFVYAAFDFAEKRASAREKKEADKRELERIKAERKLNRKKAAQEYKESTPEERKQLRAEAREEARLEREARVAEILGKAQVAYEQRRIRELEAMEQARIQEEEAAARKRKFWSGVGQFFLWLCFFPIMLIVVLVRRHSEKKENDKRMSRGFEPKDLTPIPIGFVIFGAIIFIRLVADIIVFSVSPSPSDPADTLSSKPTTTIAPIDNGETTIPVTPIAEKNDELSSTPGVPWYEQEPKEIRSGGFLFPNDTVLETNGPYQYKVSDSWIKTGEPPQITYYTSQPEQKLFVKTRHINLADTYSKTDVDEEIAKAGGTDSFLIAFADSSFRGLMENSIFSNGEAHVSILSGKKIAVLHADYNNNDAQAQGEALFYLLLNDYDLLAISVALSNGNYSIDPYNLYGMLNSIQFVEPD